MSRRHPPNNIKMGNNIYVYQDRFNNVGYSESAIIITVI